MEPKIRVSSVVRIVVECDMPDREKVLNFLYEDGWTITQQGPKRISATEIDQSIFYVVAEIKNNSEEL